MSKVEPRPELLAARLAASRSPRCRRLLLARAAAESRRAAAARRDRQSDDAGRLQAGADADAGAAAGGLQSELAVAQRLARLLQGPARAPDRRHPHGHGQHHRQGRRSTTRRSAAAPTRRIPASPISSAPRPSSNPATAILPGRILTADSNASSDGKGSVNRQEALQTNVAAVVTQVLPNGNLVVEGKQEIRVNFEIRELIVAGIVRPEDIQSDNTIDFDQDRGSPHRLWRPRPDHRRAAAALRPAGARRAAAVLSPAAHSPPLAAREQAATRRGLRRSPPGAAIVLGNCRRAEARREQAARRLRRSNHDANGAELCGIRYAEPCATAAQCRSATAVAKAHQLPAERIDRPAPVVESVLPEQPRATDTRGCRRARAASENRRRTAAAERAACPSRRPGARPRCPPRPPRRAPRSRRGLGEVPERAGRMQARDAAQDLGVLRADSLLQADEARSGSASSGASVSSRSERLTIVVHAIAGPTRPDRRRPPPAAAAPSAPRAAGAHDVGHVRRDRGELVRNASGRLISGHCRSKAGRGSPCAIDARCPRRPPAADELGLHLEDDPRAERGDARRVAHELDGVAIALLGIEEDGLAGERPRRRAIAAT